MSITTIILVLMACHWAADFTHLSRPWMLSAKSKGRPFLPILAHGAVHALLMGIACAIMVSPSVGIGVWLIQLPIHTAIDIAKGRATARFAALRDPANYYYWWVFGADQFLHQATIVLIAYLIA